jgi:hypothetical protein
MNILNVSIGLAMAATVAVLFLGLLSMARGGQFNARYGNLFMRLRVGLQGVAVLLILLATLIYLFGGD